ncbi:MAG: HSP20 family molecular chaperone IbpA [Mariniblastus sp.]|jgi:HSP20 family molecular chaperone IbpA
MPHQAPVSSTEQLNRNWHANCITSKIRFQHVVEEHFDEVIHLSNSQDIQKSKMSIERKDPFERLEEFHQQSNRIFDDLLAELPSAHEDEPTVAFQPAVDLIETPTEFRFYLSIPGLVEDDIVIEVDGQFLAIRGERLPPYDSERRRTQLQEWRYGYFERRFKLASKVTPSTVRGGYEAGVLTIVVEKNKTNSKPTSQQWADE